MGAQRARANPRHDSLSSAPYSLNEVLKQSNTVTRKIVASDGATARNCFDFSALSAIEHPITDSFVYIIMGFIFRLATTPLLITGTANLQLN